MASQPFSSAIALAWLMVLTAGSCQGSVDPGAQVAGDARAQTAGTEVHLHLVLEIDENGAVGLVSASELAGSAVFSDVPKSDYFLEISRGEEILSVEAAPGLFEAHSFGGPSGTPHHHERQARAVVSVKVPNTGLDSSHLGRIVFRLYRLRPGAPIAAVNPETFAELKRDDRLETIAETSLDGLAAEIRRRGQRVSEN